MASTGYPTFGKRYTVHALLGHGGMAEVYQAIDTTLDRIVAIKVMLPQLESDATYARRFKTEAKAAARISSPYVVSIHDWGEEDGRYYIVMEYVRGIDLRQALSQHGPLHPAKVAEIGYQACAALREAHRNGIVHRDIKPSNIMMQTSGDIKIMDFGIAQATGATTVHGMAGTIAYMSPEQRSGAHVGPQGDLYSLGVTLYELATGVLPDIAVAASTGKTLGNRPIPPSRLRRGVDGNLDAIILKALEPSLDARYQSAQDMLDDFEEYLSTTAHASKEGAFPTLWALAFTGGPAGIEGSVVAFDAPAMVGRDPCSEIAVDDEALSLQHALLTPRGMYLEVEDMASLNGTFVDGERITGCTLCQAGSTLDMGTCHAIIGKKP